MFLRQKKQNTIQPSIVHLTYYSTKVHLFGPLDRIDNNTAKK